MVDKMMLLAICVAALLVSYFSVSGLRGLAERHAIFDVPNERSSHSNSVPTGAGLAIFAVTILTVWIYAWLNPLVERLPLFTYTIGAALIAGISWLDDLRARPNSIRFAVHSVAAMLAICAFDYRTLLSLRAEQVPVVLLGVLFAFFWIVGLTNAYNFMDGIDGIAGGQAVVAGAAWTLIGSLLGNPLLSILGAILAMSSLGFLAHNWPPARIFMGDVGSAFLGYSFAVLPVVQASHVTGNKMRFQALIIGPVLMWPFVFDTTFTLLRRLRHGENIFSAHRSHLYQRLVIAGQTHRFVTILYIHLALVGALLSVGWVTRFVNGPLTTVAIIPLLGFALWGFVIRCEQRANRRHTAVSHYADSVSLESNR
jgi:UDP-N-acetylmuramyl pentapeptide phosphotransferase/UDP-N-acetylglucosamine-1-phosphate transferase